MNGAHLHLLVNHIPVFGVAFGLVALLWALARRSADMRCAAIALFLTAAIFGWLASETGESAEKIIEHLPGITKDLIHQHEEAAEAANVSTILLAAFALGLAAVARYKQRFLKATEIIVVILALVSSGLMARAAYLGGQISHPEIRSEAFPEVK